MISNRYRGIDRKKDRERGNERTFYAVQLCLLSLLHRLINTTYILSLHEENKEYVAMIQYMLLIMRCSGGGLVPGLGHGIKQALSVWGNQLFPIITH